MTHLINANGTHKTSNNGNGSSETVRLLRERIQILRRLKEIEAALAMDQPQLPSIIPLSPKRSWRSR